MNTGFEEISPEQGTRLEGAAKLRFVSELFDTIARRYDALNWFVSLGQTSLWRYFALRHLRGRLPSNGYLLDVGCGTGWVPQYLHRNFQSLNLRVEGLDCSEGMIQIAREADSLSTYRCGDACDMRCYQDGEFDCVVTVYTLRNFPDISTALREMVRVLKPGGTVLVLDAFPPRSAAMRWLLRLWLGGVVPLVTSLFSSEKAYQYLFRSIEGTVPAPEVAAMMVGAGCCEPRVHMYSLGAAGCIVAQKAAP